jgi:apolipoprotein D and lipocalin family protein
MFNFKLVFLLIFMVTGCSMPTKPLKTVPSVNIKSFMGDWYVIAHIPAFIEKNAYNAIESYKLNEDGTIQTTFTFNEGAFDGERKKYNPKGFVIEGSNNAEWGMQFIWPIKAQYKIVYVDESYTNTIVARNALDYVWLMSRNKTLPNDEVVKFTRLIDGMGYNIENLRMVPQQ